MISGFGVTAGPAARKSPNRSGKSLAAGSTGIDRPVTNKASSNIKPAANLFKNLNLKQLTPKHGVDT
jgi:hypothetical protein